MILLPPSSPLNLRLHHLTVIVPPHNALHRPQQSLKAIFAQCGHFHLALAHHAGRARFIVQQGQFAKVISLLVPLDRRGAHVLFVRLGLAALQQEKRLTGIAFADDGAAVGELLRVERVGDFRAFVQRQRVEQRHLLQEGFVHPAALKGRVHEDAAERHAIQRPQRGRAFGRDDRRGAGCIVHEGQLAERATGTDGVDFDPHAVRPWLHGARRVEINVKGPPLDHVKVVSRVPLRDHFDVFRRDGFLDQGSQYDVELLVIEVGEEEVGRHGRFQAG